MAPSLEAFASKAKQVGQQITSLRWQVWVGTMDERFADGLIRQVLADWTEECRGFDAITDGCVR